MMDYKKDMELENEEIEICLLLEAIRQKYGYDFTGYSKAHIKRRVKHRQIVMGLDSIADMIKPVLRNRVFFEEILKDFSINVTEMFRDPCFYKAFRSEVVPILKTYPFIKIWHAGCSTGEEVYSMAILLKEEGLLERTQLYATDFNSKVLEVAKEGIYSFEEMKEYTLSYQQAGGLASFSDYYVAKYDSAILNQALKKRIIFAEHNLVTDGVFGEMHVIVCRNVLIYFESQLQSKVVRLFHDSLVNGGFLCLGSKETLKYTDSIEGFSALMEEQKIYRKRFSL